MTRVSQRPKSDSRKKKPLRQIGPQRESASDHESVGQERRGNWDRVRRVDQVSASSWDGSEMSLSFVSCLLYVSTLEESPGKSLDDDKLSI